MHNRPGANLIRLNVVYFILASICTVGAGFKPYRIARAQRLRLSCDTVRARFSIGDNIIFQLGQRRSTLDDETDLDIGQFVADDLSKFERPSLAFRLFNKLRRSAANVFVVCAILLASSGSAIARTKQSGDASSSSLSSVKEQIYMDRMYGENNNIGERNDDAGEVRVVARVRVDVEDYEEVTVADRKAFYSALGWGIAGLSILSVFVRDSKGSNKRGGKGGAGYDGSSSGSNAPAYTPRVVGGTPSHRQASHLKKTGSLKISNFGSSSAAQQSTAPASKKNNIASASAPASSTGSGSGAAKVGGATGMGAGPMGKQPGASQLPPYASIVRAPQESLLPTDAGSSNTAAGADSATPTPAVAATTTPPPPPEKKGILGRLFKKPGGGRPTDIVKAVNSGNAVESEFRALVASALSKFVAKRLIPEIEQGGVYASANPAAYERQNRRGAVRDPDAEMDSSSALTVSESVSSALRNEFTQAGMSEQEAADAFADVASAILVTIVDHAAEVQEKAEAAVKALKKGVAAVDAALGERKKDEEAEKVAAALDGVSNFITGAGSLFANVTPGASIEPVQYNGRTKRSRLESLYAAYMKSAMDFGGLMGGMAAGIGAGAGDASGAGSADAEAKKMEDMQRKTAARMEKLGKIQQVFAIKEAKRSTLEQKVMREMIMGGMGGMGGALGGGLSGVMDALSGKGGLPGMDDLNPRDAAALEAAAREAGLPNFSDMKPEEMAAVSGQAMHAVKESLARGEIGRQDVLELEKMLGIDVQQMVSMMGSQASALGPDVSGMMEVFRELAEIKKR